MLAPLILSGRRKLRAAVAMFKASAPEARSVPVAPQDTATSRQAALAQDWNATILSYDNLR